MKVVCVVAVILFGLLIVDPAQAKLPVQVFVGSLCPDAIRFIQNQLNPLYPHIKDYVDLSFIPFGKAYSVGIEKDRETAPIDPIANQKMHLTTDQTPERDHLLHMPTRSRGLQCEPHPIVRNELLEGEPRCHNGVLRVSNGVWI